MECGRRYMFERLSRTQKVLFGLVTPRKSSPFSKIILCVPSHNEVSSAEQRSILVENLGFATFDTNGSVGRMGL